MTHSALTPDHRPSPEQSSIKPISLKVLNENFVAAPRNNNTKEMYVLAGALLALETAHVFSKKEIHDFLHSVKCD